MDTGRKSTLHSHYLLGEASTTFRGNHTSPRTYEGWVPTQSPLIWLQAQNPRNGALHFLVTVLSTTWTLVNINQPTTPNHGMIWRFNGNLTKNDTKGRSLATWRVFGGIQIRKQGTLTKPWDIPTLLIINITLPSARFEFGSHSWKPKL